MSSMLVDGASDTATNLSRVSDKATSFTMLGFILLLMASPLRAAPSSLGPLQVRPEIHFVSLEECHVDFQTRRMKLTSCPLSI